MRTRVEVEAVANSFCMSNASKTSMPIKINEPATTAVVTVDTVEVVIVDIKSVLTLVGTR